MTEPFRKISLKDGDMEKHCPQPKIECHSAVNKINKIKEKIQQPDSA